MQVQHVATLREGVALWTDKVTAAQTDIKAVLIAIAQVDARLKGLEPLAKYEPELAATEARITEYQRVLDNEDAALVGRLADIEAQRKAVDLQHGETFADIERRFEARCAELAVRRETLLEASSQAHQALTLAEQEADTLAPAALRLKVLDEELGSARVAWTTNEATLAGLAVRKDQLTRERTALAAKRAELQSVLDRLRQVEDRLLCWNVFVKAFGRDGLPTLEIAAAGPTVSNLTNDLLTACFGPRFSVELVTQEERADKKGLKECFELRIFDNEHGGDSRDLADLSGGERVIVDEALRAALALYVNSRNVAPIRTCWRDETLGALDPDNATRYVAMLRRLLDLGGFHHILYVSHNLDAAALADTQIVVRDGQPEVLRRVA